MQEATNVPYVKIYKKVLGNTPVLMNPIIGEYRNDGSNRSNRKASKARPMSNKTGISLVAHVGIGSDEKGHPTIIRAKYQKVRQIITWFSFSEVAGKVTKKTRAIYHEVDRS